MLEEKLKSARKATGISQKDIAKKLFISQQAYAKYETGVQHLIQKHLKELQKFLTYLLITF